MIGKTGKLFKIFVIKFSNQLIVAINYTKRIEIKKFLLLKKKIKNISLAIYSIAFKSDFLLLNSNIFPILMNLRGNEHFAFPFL